MAKEAFTNWNPRAQSIERLGIISEILADFGSRKIKVTLRQLFYQLVGRDIINNLPSEYAKLSDLMTKARMAGMIDWSAIEDRARQPHQAAEFESLGELVDAACAAYRLPRWRDQPSYIELWCEKDALSSVIKPICDELHVTLMVNRGYSSSTAMYDASKRILDRANGRPVTIIYLGDFDPSGEDMVRDIRDRLHTFLSGTLRGHRLKVRVSKLALTYDQVKLYKLPPNTAKMKDSRAADFVAKYGPDSYEVDAIHPDELQGMIAKALKSHMNMRAYNKWAKIEAEHKELLTEVSDEIARRDE